MKYLPFLILLTSCSPNINKLILNVDSVNTNDFCTCNYHLSGLHNKTILTDTCGIFKSGDKLKLKPTTFNHGVIYELHSVMPFEHGFSQYEVKRKKSKITFTELDSVVFDFSTSNKFRLIKSN